MITKFEAVLVVFGAASRLADSRLAGRPRGDRENLPGRSGTVYVLAVLTIAVYSPTC